MSKKFTKLFVGDVVKTVGSRVFRKLTSHTTPTTITFTIDGTTYQAEDGMTWEQWVNSDYNTAPICYISGTSVLYSNDPSGTTIGAITGATSTSQITSGAIYSSSHGGGTN